MPRVQSIELHSFFPGGMVTKKGEIKDVVLAESANSNSDTPDLYVQVGVVEQRKVVLFEGFTDVDRTELRRGQFCELHAGNPYETDYQMTIPQGRRDKTRGVWAKLADVSAMGILLGNSA